MTENDWIDVNDKKPPPFFLVFVMNGKRKMEAYFCPIEGWQSHTKKSEWNTTFLKKVTHWKEIKSFTFLQQHEECARLKNETHYDRWKKIFRA